MGHTFVALARTTANKENEMGRSSFVRLTTGENNK